MKLGQDALASILCVTNHVLHSNEVVSRNNRLVMVELSILISVLAIFHRPVVKIVRSPSFTSKDIAAVPLVLQLLKNSTRRPNCVAFLGFPFKQGKLISDILTGISVKVHEEYKTDGLGFLLINDEHAFAVQVITEQLRC